jgi:Icc-related predicted phosphoesterase
MPKVDKLRLAILSDTHGNYPLDLLNVAPVDLLILAGDILADPAEKGEFLSFLKWAQEAHAFVKNIVLVGGNHDAYLYEHDAAAQRALKESGVTYLRDNLSEIEGLKIYGFPWVREIGYWSFEVNDETMKRKIELIPEGVDILVSHGPGYGILDQDRKGVNAGCSDLKFKVLEIQPLLHLFGHIHEGAGHHYDARGNIHYVNAAALTPVDAWSASSYLPPVFVELEREAKERWKVTAVY